MKITDFKTYIIGNPPPSFGGKYWIFLKLTTDSGIVGFGEAYAIPFHPSVATKMIEDICQRYVVGESPFCLLYTSPSPRDATLSRMPSSA